MNLVYKIAVIVLMGIVSCKGKDKDHSNASIRTESEIDRIKLTDMDNSPIDLGQYRGKTLFINFWATWCKPCIEEMPSISKAKAILRNENVIFLLASDEDTDIIEKFRSRHDYDLNYVRLTNMEEINIQALPTTFIFNPEGDLIFSEMGYRKWDDKNNIDMIRKIANKND